MTYQIENIIFFVIVSHILYYGLHCYRTAIENTIKAVPISTIKNTVVYYFNYQ